MKVGLWADLHGELPEALPERVDVLVLVGDLLPDARQEVFWTTKFVPWLKQIKQWTDFIILVAGNHDFLLETSGERWAGSLPPSVVYLQNSGVVVNGVKFWGMPFICPVPGWAFERDAFHMMAEYEKVEEGVDVLLTHQPPVAGTLSRGIRGNEFGSREIAHWIRLKRPKLVVCGHIHEGYGRGEVDGIPVFNVARMDVEYYPVNKMVVVEIDREGRLKEEKNEVSASGNG